MLTFLRELMDAIQDLYLNGREPKLGIRSYGSYRQAVADSAKNVLTKVAKES
jgi:hypothetical protein